MILCLDNVNEISDMLLDIHTHRAAPYPEGIISQGAEEFNPFAGQLYSVGIHPWDVAATLEGVDAQCQRLVGVAESPAVAAIGECGFDALRGAAMMLQTKAFRFQVDLSEQLRKPLIIHAVKTLDMILAWRKESGATQPWIVHGFRGKPTAAQQLLRAGCYLSFGAKFNEETLRSVPSDSLFAETDESTLPVAAIIEMMSEVRAEDMFAVVAANMNRLFGKEII